MSGVALPIRKASSELSGDGTKGARVLSMFRLIGGARALWILVLFCCFGRDADANSLRVSDSRTQVTISAPQTITEAWLYATDTSLLGAGAGTPPSVEIPLSKGSSGVLGGLTPLASVSWSGSTITIRKALVPMTGQYVLPIRGEIGDLVGISETASQFVFGCKVKAGGVTMTCTLLSYVAPKFCVYMNYIESAGSFYPLVSGASVWGTYKKMENGKWITLGDSNSPGPQPTIKTHIKTESLPVAVVVKGEEATVKARVSDFTGRPNAKLPAVITAASGSFYGTRSLVNRRTRTNVSIPPECQYSGFDFAVATNKQWAYVKGMALYDGVTLVPISDSDRFDFSVTKKPVGLSASNPYSD